MNNEKNGIVSQWYETKKNVDEMRHWEQPRLKKWENDVTACFPAAARILDIGCGLGREAFVLTDMGYQVTGIDISQEVIRQIRPLSAEKGYKIPFLIYDGHTLPFPNASFDIVLIWSQTFGLLYGTAYKREFLTECRRVLENCGLLSFSGHDDQFLQVNYTAYVKERKFYPYADTEMYWDTFEANELADYAQQAGFDVITCAQGEICKPEDGVVLHCLCRKRTHGKEE